MSDPTFTVVPRGRTASEYTRQGIQLAAYVRFITVGGNDTAPREIATVNDLNGKLTFQYSRPGLGQSIYGIQENGIAVLLAFVVDSSD